MSPKIKRPSSIYSVPSSSSKKVWFNLNFVNNFVLLSILIYVSVCVFFLLTIFLSKLEKDRDIEVATIKLRNDLQNEIVKGKELSTEIQNLQHQLAEAKNGLLAASRISDQLEMSQITITTLKTECKCYLVFFVDVIFIRVHNFLCNILVASFFFSKYVMIDK